MNAFLLIMFSSFLLSVDKPYGALHIFYSIFLFSASLGFFSSFMLFLFYSFSVFIYLGALFCHKDIFGVVSVNAFSYNPLYFSCQSVK